ncbi:MAG TPA: hypothetical protein VMV83_03685 [Rectinemataceae bacterium]|nr:hypothetical protein [Rectinemataceae bacterium]
MARLRIFAGPNGSGKSSLYSRLVDAGHFHRSIYINADEIQAGLASSKPVSFPLDQERRFFKLLRESPFVGHGLSEKALTRIEGNPSHGLRLAKGAESGGYLAAAIADAIRTLCVEEGKSFAFESVMSHPSKLSLLEEAHLHGFRNYLYFVTTENPDLNVERVQQRMREGGHPVSEEKIRQRYTRSMGLLRDAIARSDRAYLFDNSGPETFLVASVDGGHRLTIESDIVPSWLATLVHALG